MVGVELIDTALESQVWGRAFDHRADDIFRIQNEIASECANFLRFELTESEKKKLSKCSTENRAAYHLFLKAIYFANKWNPEGFQKGFAYARQAIEIDPAYAEAYAGLAYLYVLTGFLGVAPVETFAKAKAAAVKALEIDDVSLMLTQSWGSCGWSMIGIGRDPKRNCAARSNWARTFPAVTTLTAIGT